jgi:hypothetical protein
VCCHCARSRGAAAFLEGEADESGGGGGSSGDEGGSAADGQESAGSLADFVVEPTAEDFEQAGLTYHSSEDEGDPTAVLRETHPFRRFRLLEPEPAVPVLGASRAASAGGRLPAGLAAVAAQRKARGNDSFMLLLANCPWLPDAALLHDAAMSDELWRQVQEGYKQERARRQAKQLDGTEGLLELTACMDYCVHIVSVRLGLLWHGAPTAPGEKVCGSLMRPYSEHPVACELVTAHGRPLELGTLLLSIVLEHPSNERWRNIVIGRKMHRSNELLTLVQGKVRERLAHCLVRCVPLCCSFRVCVHGAPLCDAACVYAGSCRRTSLIGAWWLTRIECSTSRLARRSRWLSSTLRRAASASSGLQFRFLPPSSCPECSVCSPSRATASTP